MQFFFVFSFPHGPGVRFEGCLFFFRPYLSSNSNDKPRAPVLSPKCSDPKSLKNPYICLRIKIFKFFSKCSVKTKVQVSSNAKIKQLLHQQNSSGGLPKTSDQFKAKIQNFQRSRRKRAERGRLRFWCLLEALKLVKTLWKWSQGTGLVMRIPKITLGSQNGGQTAEWWPIENRQNFANLEFGNDGFNLVWRPSYVTFFHFLFSARSGNEI